MPIAAYAREVADFSDEHMRGNWVAHRKSSLLHIPCFAGLVAFSDVTRPDPIPNSAVKRVRADGTMSQDLGE